MHPRWLIRTAALSVVIVFALLGYAVASDSIRTPAACERLAKQHGFIALPAYTRSEAKDALKHLGVKYILDRDARQCRAALIQALAK